MFDIGFFEVFGFEAVDGLGESNLVNDLNLLVFGDFHKLFGYRRRVENLLDSSDISFPNHSSNCC